MFPSEILIYSDMRMSSSENIKCGRYVVINLCLKNLL